MILHHYTSGTGLLGIINSSSIWSTNIHFMNDSQEFIHALDMAKSEIIALRQSSTSLREISTYDNIISTLDHSTQLSVHVACFSEKGDSLSQWRGYCPSGFGYNIGFNKNLLGECASQQGFYLRKCIYNPHEKKSTIQKWGERVASSIKEDINKIDDLIKQLLLIAPFFKHESFIEESEWRLISFINLDDVRINLRPGKSTLIPYVPLDLKLNEKSELIWNICVGPTPNIGLAFRALPNLFNKLNVVNGIIQTQIPYRDW